MTTLQLTIPNDSNSEFLVSYTYNPFHPGYRERGGLQVEPDEEESVEIETIELLITSSGLKHELDLDWLDMERFNEEILERVNADKQSALEDKADFLFEQRREEKCGI